MSNRHAHLIAGTLLAGGNARRMGGLRKGEIRRPDGKTIAEHLIEEIKKAGIENIVISANKAAPYIKYRKPVLIDNYLPGGPLAGIEAVLSQLKNKCKGVLFVPCDLPMVSASEFDTLIQRFLSSKKKVVYAVSGVFFSHPLCTVVHIDALSEIQNALKEKQYKVSEIWDTLKAEPVNFEKNDAFINLNTPKDIEDWSRMRMNDG